ncbi:MAG: hypothetical protein M9962_10025 [Oligoflexia bacterium]|nr:hypothetical protein [Oligoflexia bacterium]
MSDLTLFLSLSLWIVAYSLLLIFSWQTLNIQTENDSWSFRLLKALFLSNSYIISGVLICFAFGIFNKAFFFSSPLLLALGPWIYSKYSAKQSLSFLAKHDKLILFSLLIFFVLFVFSGLSLPAFHHDTLSYHLPAAALSWQKQTLFFSTWHPQIGTNPLMAELPKIWAFAISSNDSLTNIQQVPYLLGLAIASFYLATELNVSAFWARLAAISVLLIPKILDQVLTANIDIIASFYMVCSCIFILRKNYFLSMIATVFLANMKYTTLLPATICALIITFILFRKNKITAATWIVIFTFFGWFWEWKNIVQFGNPIAPYQILVNKPINTNIQNLVPNLFIEKGKEDQNKWDGYFINNIERAAGNKGLWLLPRYYQAWSDSYYVPYDEFSARWGPTWFICVVPFLCFFIFHILRNKNKELILSSLFVIILYFSIIKSWELRLGLFITPFGFAITAWGFHKLQKALQWNYVFSLIYISTLIWSSYQAVSVFPQYLSFISQEFRKQHTPYSGLLYAGKNDAAAEVQSLAAALNQTKAASVLIDYTFGSQHHYGMVNALLYPYFSSDWNRRMLFSSSSANSPDLVIEIVKKSGPQYIILQPGSLVDKNLLLQNGYRLYFKNKAGELYEQT